MDLRVVPRDRGPTEPLALIDLHVVFSFMFFKDWHLFDSSQLPCASSKNHGNDFEIASGIFFKHLGVNFIRHS